MFVTEAEAKKYVAKIEADIDKIKIDLVSLLEHTIELSNEQERHIEFMDRVTHLIIEKHNALVEYVVPPRTFDWAYRQAQGIYGR